MALNEVTLNGRITDDLSLETWPSGTEYVNFTVAVEANFKNKDGKRDTFFIDCTAISGTAKMIETYFHKGDGIIITGSLNQDKWEKDGKKFSKLYVKVDAAYFAVAKKKDGSEPAEAPGEFKPDESNGELPF